jgi:hypothetical protein
MPLPTSRNTTYTPGSQVKSADLNDFQDQIIGLFAGRRAPRRRLIPPTAGRFEGNPSSGTVVLQNGWIQNTAGTERLFIPVTVEQGERILLVELMIDPAATGTPSFQLQRDDGDGLSTSITGVIAASGQGRQKLTSGPLAEIVGSGNISYFVVVSSGAVVGMQVGPVYLTTDRP